MIKPLLLVGAAAGVILIMLFWTAVFKVTRSHRTEPASHAFVPDPKNDKRITVRGWRRQEIESVLGEFANMYGEVFVATSPGTAGGTTLLSFPRDIPSDQYFFLVNYLTYPQGRDARDSLAVIGKVTLTDTFDLPDPSLAGKKRTTTSCMSRSFPSAST